MIDRTALAKCCSWPIIRQSLWVALIVGTLLNGINQGVAILSAVQFGTSIIWWKIALTYCVPFLVANYGAYSALALSAPETKP
jgi:hypothetical protein